MLVFRCRGVSSRDVGDRDMDRVRARDRDRDRLGTGIWIWIGIGIGIKIGIGIGLRVFWNRWLKVSYIMKCEVRVRARVSLLLG